MSLTARLRCVLEGALRRKRMEQDMDIELGFHVAKYTEDLIATGMPREQAERQARIEFGHIEPLKEECRQARGLRWWDETIQDVRYAGRMLRKSPGFAAVAVLTLALGIGANTAIFSVVNAWVLKPLPYANPDELVSILAADVKGAWVSGVSGADLADWRKEKKDVFEHVCGWAANVFTFDHDDQPEPVAGARVSSDFFQMLGVAPQSGRGFLAVEELPGSPRVVVLSHELVENRLGNDSALVGKTIQIDGEAATVVGIMPAGFHVPLMGTVNLWTPLRVSEDRRARFARVIARMKPGVSLPAASGYLKTIAGRLANSYPATNAGQTVQLRSLRDEFSREGGSQQAMVVFWLVGCVLLLACSNVANLVVGRAVSRQKEMAVRLAIGAGRGRLLRQLLTENVVLFLLAAALSVGFAMWGVRWIENAIPPEVRGFLPNSAVLSVDAPAFVYMIAIALVSGVLFGFAPAFRCWRIDVNDALKENAARVSASGASGRLKNGLIVVETALALVVLVAAGLLAKGMVRMYARDLGFQPDGLVTARILLSGDNYNDTKRIAGFKKAVLDQIGALPGVQAAAAGNYIPYGSKSSAGFYAIDGRPIPVLSDRPYTMLDDVSPGYFGVMGIPLLRGRAFSEQDRADSLPVVIINQTLAQRHWPQQDPLGQRIRYGANLDHMVTIVGVVKDTAGQDDTELPMPQIYRPYQQLPVRGMTFVMRADSSAQDIAAGIRRAVRAVDKGQAVLRVENMQALMAASRAPYVIVGKVSSFFAGLSLFLAALGIYGVMAYSVAARKQEFGIRLALGAAGRDLTSLVVGQGLKLAAIGLGIGLAAALGVTRLMSSILFQVSPTDGPTFTLISLLLLAVAGLASYLPARRASRISPTRALRSE